MRKFHELLKSLKTHLYLKLKIVTTIIKIPSNFAGKFYRDIKTLYEALPVNPFMLKNKMMCKINDPCTDLPKDTFVTLSEIIEEGEKQFRSLIHQRLLYQKVLYHKNNFNPWHPRQTQFEKHHPPSSSVIGKYILLLSTGKSYQEPYLNLRN